MPNELSANGVFIATTERDCENYEIHFYGDLQRFYTCCKDTGVVGAPTAGPCVEVRLKGFELATGTKQLEI